MKRGDKKAAIVAAIESGFCNTSQDVADETGLPIKVCSGAVHNLVKAGALRHTGRVIRGEYRNRPSKVFEVVA